MSTLKHSKPRPLRFSGYHGCNIMISDNKYLSNGQYRKAHGQFITQDPLRSGDAFILEFKGTGIVKFNTFMNKRHAVDWLLSQQPLSRGCIRIKMKAVARYIVRVSELENCLKVVLEQRSESEASVLSLYPQTTLGFDIECGDVSVSIITTTAYVTFDTHFISANINIVTSQGTSTASLQHYNPSAMCCLENIPLVLGAIYMLNVRHSGLRMDSGSYIRVCVSKIWNPYVNDEVIPFCGTSICSGVQGRKVHLATGVPEIILIRVMPNGLVIYSKRKEKRLDMIMCNITSESTLWFELHKVDLRVWQILDDNKEAQDGSIIQAELSTEAALLSKHALPPPVCRRRKHANTMCSQVVHIDELKEVVRDKHFIDISSIDRERSNTYSASSNRHDGYVLADSCGQSEYLDHAQNSTIHSNTNNLQPDHLADSTLGASIEPYLVILSSLESFSDIKDADQNQFTNHNKKPSTNSPLYEKPGSIWLKPKAAAHIQQQQTWIADNKEPPQNASTQKSVVTNCTLPPTITHKSILTLSKTECPGPKRSSTRNNLKRSNTVAGQPQWSTPSTNRTYRAHFDDALNTKHEMDIQLIDIKNKLRNGTSSSDSKRNTSPSSTTPCPYLNEITRYFKDVTFKEMRIQSVDCQYKDNDSLSQVTKSINSGGNFSIKEGTHNSSISEQVPLVKHFTQFKISCHKNVSDHTRRLNTVKDTVIKHNTVETGREHIPVHHLSYTLPHTTEDISAGIVSGLCHKKIQKEHSVEESCEFSRGISQVAEAYPVKKERPKGNVYCRPEVELSYTNTHLPDHDATNSRRNAAESGVTCISHSCKTANNIMAKSGELSSRNNDSPALMTTFINSVIAPTKHLANSPLPTVPKRRQWVLFPQL